MADIAAQPGQAVTRQDPRVADLCGLFRGWSRVVPTPAAAHGGISRDGPTGPPWGWSARLPRTNGANRR